MFGWSKAFTQSYVLIHAVFMVFRLSKMDNASELLKDEVKISIKLITVGSSILETYPSFVL